MMVAGFHAETRMVASQRAVPNFVFLAAAIRATRRPVGLSRPLCPTLGNYANGEANSIVFCGVCMTCS